MGLKFQKYHGLGNDYLVYDCIKNDYELTTEDIRLLCNRNLGLGSDGILVGPIYFENRIGMKIYNPDGSEAEKSGNGIRIFAKYLKDAGYVQTKEFLLHTSGGEVKVKYKNELGNIMTVYMGKLSFQREEVGAVDTKEEMINIPLWFGHKEYWCTCVSIGNPHCVIPMEEISKEIVCSVGADCETARYFPNRINTQVVKVIDKDNIQIEIFERGAGYTLASGSSACAAVGAMYRLGMTGPDVSVHMPGGKLMIHIEEDWTVSMTGGVCYVGEMTVAEEFMNYGTTIED